MSGLQFLLCVYLWLYVSIFCHEMGHCIAASLSGFNPYLIKIGTGKRILKFKLLRIWLEVRLVPGGGITHISNLALEGLKLKLALTYLSGPLVNCLLLWMLYQVHSYPFIRDSMPLGFLASIELCLIAGNLAPIESRMYGMTLPTDGKQTIDAIFRSEQQFIQKYLGLSRYASASDKAENVFFRNELKALQTLFTVQVQLNRHNFSEAIELLEPLLARPDFLIRDRVYMIDLLASIAINYGEKKYLSEADYWSAQALALADNIKTLQGTRGAILVEMGRYSEGKAMLLPLTEAGNDPVDIAVSSCYIAKADYFLGENTVKDWLKKAERVGAAHQILLRTQRELSCFI